jgi:hypothetical protein
LHAIYPTGLESLGQRVTGVKTYLQSQIKALSNKQDQTIQAQAKMQEHLAHVGADVESTRMEVSEVGALLHDGVTCIVSHMYTGDAERPDHGKNDITVWALIYASIRADAWVGSGAGSQHGSVVA